MSDWRNLPTYAKDGQMRPTTPTLFRVASLRRVAPVLAVVCGFWAGGCGAGEEMNADTTCRDFLQASYEDQNAAIARVADELGTENSLTPLGRPNIDYLCTGDQDRTLGEAVKATG
jgi:hypothetical protein